MTTNLLIAFPDMSTSATLTYGTAPTSGASNYDMLAGPRYLTYQRSTAGTSSVFDFDMGASATQAPNFIIIARAKMLSTQDATATVTVQSANAYFTPIETTGALTISSFLSGPGGDDFNAGASIFTAFATPRRYWRVTIGTTNSFKHEFSKLYLGTYFDMGFDPSYPMSVSTKVGSSKDRKPRFTFDYNWRGVTTAKVQELRLKLLMKKDIYPVFLDDTNASYHLYTVGNKVINTWIREATITQTGHNRHDVNISFEELT